MPQTNSSWRGVESTRMLIIDTVLNVEWPATLSTKDRLCVIMIIFIKLLTHVTQNCCIIVYCVQYMSLYVKLCEIMSVILS